MPQFNYEIKNRPIDIWLKTLKRVSCLHTRLTINDAVTRRPKKVKCFSTEPSYLD